MNPRFDGPAEAASVKMAKEDEVALPPAAAAHDVVVLRMGPIPSPPRLVRTSDFCI